MEYTIEQLRAMDDAALNRVVLERLGYTAPDRSCDGDPAWYLLLGADGLTASNWDRRIYFDLADYDSSEDWPEGWQTDGNGYYVTKIGWDSEDEAFASGPQYVSDLNVAETLMDTIEDNEIYIERGWDHEGKLYYKVFIDLNSEPRPNETHLSLSRAIVLAWLATEVNGE